MVRRRGTYNINVIGKRLVCLFCGNKIFRHREVYVKMVYHEPGFEKKKLTLQTFYCTKCSHEMKFQERKENDVSNIEYIEVSKS